MVLNVMKGVVSQDFSSAQSLVLFFPGGRVPCGCCRALWLHFGWENPFSLVSPWFQQIRLPPLRWVETKHRSLSTRCIPTKCTKYASQPAPAWATGPRLSGPSTGLLTGTTKRMVGAGWRLGLGAGAAGFYFSEGELEA